MPHDLFGDVVVRPPAARTRQSSVVAFSIVAHTLVIAALLIMPLVAVDGLPTPRRALAFFDASAIVPVVPPPPPPRTAPVPRRAVAEPQVAPNAAPVVPPTGVAPETGLEQSASRDVLAGPVIGVVEGVKPGDLTLAPATTPPPPPAAPMRLSTGMQPPRKIVDVAPVYPPLARAAHVQGVVILEATIDARGNVESTRVLRSIALLDAAAVDAVRQWKFTPTLLNGVPIPIVMTVTVNFRLSESF